MVLPRRAARKFFPVLLAATGAAGAAGGCNAILGNTELTPGADAGDAGTDTTMKATDAHPPDDRASPGDRAMADVGEASTFCQKARAELAADGGFELGFCDDFDDASDGAPFGFNALDVTTGGMMTLTPMRSESPPTSLLGSVEARDASVNAFAVEDVSCGTAGGLPATVSFDVFVVDSCLTGAGTLQLFDLAIPTGGPHSEVYLQMKFGSFYFGLATFDHSSVSYAGGTTFSAGEKNFQSGNWFNVRFAFEPSGGRAGLVLSTALPDGDGGRLVAFEGGLVTDGGFYLDASQSRVKLGLEYIQFQTPACSVYLDNVVIACPPH